MRAHGKVNVVAVLLVAGVIGGLWWVITFSTAYLDNADLKSAVTGCFAESNRVEDETIRGRIMAKASEIGTHEEDDGYGTITEMKGLGLKEEDITITRDDVREYITIRVEYVREVPMRPFNRVKKMRFVLVKEGPVPPL